MNTDMQTNNQMTVTQRKEKIQLAKQGYVTQGGSHTDCPNAIKTLLPPVYNPKSVRTGNFFMKYRS